MWNGNGNGLPSSLPRGPNFSVPPVTTSSSVTPASSSVTSTTSSVSLLQLQSRLTNPAANPQNSGQISITGMQSSASGVSASGSSSLQTLYQLGQPGSQITTSTDEGKNKCKKFLEFLLELSAKKSQATASIVKDLIQGLIDEQISPEDFADQLKRELNSQTQPRLTELLKKNLPSLRHSLAMKALSIDGIRSPFVSVAVVPVPPVAASIPQTQPQQNISAAKAKYECRRFLLVLLELSAKQSSTKANIMKDLIQGFVDEQISPEDFTDRVERETNSQLQPRLTGFLKKSLPFLRHALAMKELSIDGIQPPTVASVTSITATAVVPQTQPQQNAAFTWTTTLPGQTLAPATTTTTDEAMNKCKNFLAFLLESSTQKNPGIAVTAKSLIQDLVDGKISAERFAHRLKRDLNSQSRPGLPDFLKKNLPLVQRALATREIFIDGIQPPSLPTTAIAIADSYPGSSAAALRVPAAMTVTVAPPTPPDWDKSCAAAILPLIPFVKELVDKASLEYEVLAELVTSSPGVTVTNIERIVNLTLWKKFVAKRRELMVAKTRDLELLSGFGLSDEHTGKRFRNHATRLHDFRHKVAGKFGTFCMYGDEELQHQIHIQNFKLGEEIPEYADNVGLLLHCTTENVKHILSQGLDERLGNDTGLLGRGIYFADDPAKAAQYDANNLFIVCAVYLGDCQYNYSNERHKREPEKPTNLQRIPSDYFFDSIVGRPTRKANEFVIYNRDKCVPLYLVHYRWNYAGSIAVTDLVKSYTEARSFLPPFAWTPTPTGMHLWDPTQANRWPFFAQTIFNLMKPDTLDSIHSLGSTNSDDSKMESQLSALRDLGFTDDQSNTEKLIDFGFNLELTIDALLNSTKATVSPPDLGSTEPIRAKVIQSTYAASAAVSNTTGTDPGTFANQPATCPIQAPVKKAKLDNSNSGTSGNAGNPTSQPPNAIPKIKLKRVPSIPSNNWAVQTAAIAQPTATASVSMGSASSTQDNYASMSTLSVSALPPNNAAVEVSSSLAVNSSAAPAAPAPASTQQNGNDQSPDADCPICCVRPSHWTSLTCSHQLCTDCYQKLHTSGQTMSGKTHTWIKCPFCNGVSGFEIGTCPDGIMRIEISSDSLPGYQGYSTIAINYLVNKGKYVLNRTAFLPNSPEGQRIVGLLRTAWDRRLVFSIGTSLTLEKSDVLIWNIHHKTGLTGGAPCHAYPDPDYLDRLLSELKQYGIE